MTEAHPDTQGDEHRLFERISRERFDALALWGMPRQMREDTLSASHWSADNERVIAGVFHVIATKQFMCVAFARDTAGRYRPFQRSHFLPSARAGELALKRDFGRGLLTAQPEFPAADAQPEGVDLFATLGNIGRHHDAYVMLRDGFNQGAARALLEEVSRWVPDLDGNLARDFQTSGYSARVWELYLWAALRALNFDMDYTHAAPDFCVRKGGKTVFVEATTVNSQDTFSSAVGAGPPPDAPEQLWPFLENQMPQKFGSPLFSKMKKRYWDKAHVAGHPLLLAIADFHAPASMRWSQAALPFYLYGLWMVTTVDTDNQLVELLVPGPDHVVGGKVVPTNFFAQPDAEHISGVLFSNAGTIVKFSRMGTRAGFGDPWVSLVRKGVLIDPATGMASAVPFNIDVESPDYAEGWSDELILFHNPRALHPVDQALFPGITHVHLDDGEYVVHGPSVAVLHSTTTSYDFLRRHDGRPAWLSASVEAAADEPGPFTAPA
ncbi:hypothetical protein [Sphingomonas sp.]|uniref:hypothetical protein n=1 Tax=Sphingomonas sp. TaxID=28214 RepID=UPI003340BFEC